MWARFYQALAACVDLLLPPACLLCGQLLRTDQGKDSLCRACLAGMPPLGPAHCPCCAQPYPSSTSSHLCGACLKRPPTFSTVHAAVLYEDRVKDAIHRFKYRIQLTLTKSLGQLLGQVFVQSGGEFSPHCIVPVSLHTGACGSAATTRRSRLPGRWQGSWM